MHEISSTPLEQDWSVEIIEELVEPKMHDATGDPAVAVESDFRITALLQCAFF